MLIRMLLGAFLGIVVGVAIPIVWSSVAGGEGAINVAGWFWFVTVPGGLMLGIILGAVSSLFE
ncbi:hypothetical protein Pla108_05370 [Botrimarina colliarenosi]|uniref:Uncharacterized protein n=1 Tax=Botrimarina colliarenosi TaxID=2528001 RepID=A0A5C6AHX8_9BACT|nr:hypothetical protein Pla108_05370 [Botrimarina colliarenosi]